MVLLKVNDIQTLEYLLKTEHKIIHAIIKMNRQHVVKP